MIGEFLVFQAFKLVAVLFTHFFRRSSHWPLSLDLPLRTLAVWYSDTIVSFLPFSLLFSKRFAKLFWAASSRICVITYLNLLFFRVLLNCLHLKVDKRVVGIATFGRIISVKCAREGAHFDRVVFGVGWWMDFISLKCAVMMWGGIFTRRTAWLFVVAVLPHQYILRQ